MLTRVPPPPLSDAQVGCKTDGGLTVILVPRQEGVKTTQMTTRYSKAAGTAYITFDNVRVPVENTLGEEDNGLVRFRPFLSLPLPPSFHTSLLAPKHDLKPFPFFISVGNPF